MDVYRQYITKNPKETAQIGSTIANSLLTQNGGDHTICLYGDLGSGKTTFVQGFASPLGLTHRLLSPTFIIVRRYELSNKFRYLYHIDLYRLTEIKDRQSLGLIEILSDPASIVVIEWADRLQSFLPIKRMDIDFSLLPDGSHKVQIKQRV